MRSPTATAGELIRLLELRPHPEGGHFSEVWRSPERLSALPPPYPGSRSLSTSIYCLLAAGESSRMHRLRSDEIYHFYLGDPVELLVLEPGRVGVPGPDLALGERPQLVVRRGSWQGGRLKKGGGFALTGTTVAPGFDYADYEPGTREALVRDFPDFSDSRADAG